MKKSFILIIITALSLTLFSCRGKKYPEPTFRYYVNDYAESLMQYTERKIESQNKYLYEVYGDIQIIYATFFVESIAEIANYDIVEIFEQWQPGNKDTDMGLLVILFVSNYKEDDQVYQEIIQVKMEPGYGLEEYLTPIEMNTLRDNYLLSNMHYGIIDMQLMHFQYEMLNHLYLSVYDEDPQSYDMDEFYNEMMNAPYIQEETGSGSIFSFFLKEFSLGRINLSFGWLFIIGFSLLGGGLGLGFIRSRGGGGRSGGRGV